MSRLSLSLVALVTALAAGCQPACPQLCAENAEYLGSCLEHWEALWPDLGHESGQEYIDTCNDRYVTAIRLVGAANARDIRVGCADDLTSLAGSVGCADYLPSDVEIDPTEGDNGVAPRPGGF